MSLKGKAQDLFSRKNFSEKLLINGGMSTQFIMLCIFYNLFSTEFVRVIIMVVYSFILPGRCHKVSVGGLESWCENLLK